MVRECEALPDALEANPKTGAPISHGCYKIRLAIASKGAGKRGGARVITYVQVVGETMFLLVIYDKSGQGSVSGQQALQLLSLLE